MEKTNSNMVKLFAAVFLFVFTISLISSAGIVRPYWDENPLKLAPGESKTITLTLQNTDTEDFSVEINLQSEVATLLNENNVYHVPAGDINVPVELDVVVSEDAEIGEIYDTRISVNQVSSEEGGMVSLASALSVNFPLEVVNHDESELRQEQSLQENNPTTIIVSVLVLLGLVALGAYYRKNKK